MNNTTEGIALSENECLCCKQELNLKWTDSHGVAVCTTCGLPYRVYFYDDDDNRIHDAPIRTALLPAGVDIAKEYWNEKRMRVFPAVYSFMPSDRNSYCGASIAECEAFYQWEIEKGYLKR